jgi:hypothetical protein
MGLADGLPDVVVKPFMVDTLLDSLDADDAAVFAAWLADLSIGAGRISTAMKKNGTPVSESTIRAWRRHHVVG